MLTPLICPSRGLASTNQGRANPISFSSHLGRDSLFLSLFKSLKWIFFGGEEERVTRYSNNAVWGKRLFTKGEISHVISFPASSNRFGVFLKAWGWIYVGTAVGWQKGWETCVIFKSNSKFIHPELKL